MKTYKVTLVEKGYEKIGSIILRIEVANGVHPSKVAKELYEKMGWNVDKDNLRVVKIERII